MSNRIQLAVFVFWVAAVLGGGAHASMFGEELIPLAKLVAGQVIELEKLAQMVGVAKEQRELLTKINDGIQKTTRQIETIEEVVRRAKALDPSAVNSVAKLTNFLRDVKTIHSQTEEVVSLKILLADQAISQTGLQVDTTYKMGQEMVGAGAELSEESRDASPGRASQISAAAASSQMLASGVQLQTLAQIAQLQAMSLELQKTQLEREMEGERMRRAYLGAELSRGSKAGSAL